MELLNSNKSGSTLAKLSFGELNPEEIKIKELGFTPYPNDSKKLKGIQTEYYRVDVGEFRIIYEIKAGLTQNTQ